MRLLVLATGEFALPTFRRLLDSPHAVAGLVTQPDRTGRGHHQHVNPLKELALERSLPVFQPEKSNSPESLDRLGEFKADLFVVAAYGQILSADLLAIPRLGAINLHGSLLPKYRGAAPIQYAIWKGETRTGITIFQIEPKLDAGPMLGVVETDIGPKETSGQLHDRLAELAAPLTLEVVGKLESGAAIPLPQSSEQVTRAPKLKKEQGRIDWTRSAREIGWQVRAMQPWPVAETLLKRPSQPDIRLLVLDVDEIPETDSTASPGDVVVRDGEFHIRTGEGWLRLNVLQPPGKRAMPAADFLRGTDVSGGCME